jgi:glutaconate CoA-transferase subunit B
MVQDKCGWSVRFGENLEVSTPPNIDELTILRELKARTKAAHEAGV